MNAKVNIMCSAPSASFFSNLFFQSNQLSVRSFIPNTSQNIYIFFSNSLASWSMVMNESRSPVSMLPVECSTLAVVELTLPLRSRVARRTMTAATISTNSPTPAPMMGPYLLMLNEFVDDEPLSDFPEKTTAGMVVTGAVVVVAFVLAGNVDFSVFCDASVLPAAVEAVVAVVVVVVVVVVVEGHAANMPDALSGSVGSHGLCPLRYTVEDKVCGHVTCTAVWAYCAPNRKNVPRTPLRSMVSTCIGFRSLAHELRTNDCTPPLGESTRTVFTVDTAGMLTFMAEVFEWLIRTLEQVSLKLKRGRMSDKVRVRSEKDIGGESERDR